MIENVAEGSGQVDVQADWDSALCEAKFVIAKRYGGLQTMIK